YRFDALRRQHCSNLVYVLAAAGLEVHYDLHVTDGNVGEGAAMCDLEDVGAGAGDAVGEAGELAGAVADLDDQAGEAAVGDETAVDDAADHGDVDVAA